MSSDRIVSLVPSVTDALDRFGVADRVVGVTTYCTHGAPDAAVRVGGTKNPDVQRIIALRPDLVVTNTEENRPEDIQRLRDAGLTVEETYPRTVADAAKMTRRLGELVDATAVAADLADAVDAAIEAARAAAPSTRVMALTLVWRKPWMGLGPGTYASDLLWTCGFGNVLSGYEADYPRLEAGLAFGADVALLPSEPYAFEDKDLDPVRELAGDVATRFVDGELLTWHGPRTADGLRTFSALAVELAAELPG
ncbi:Metal binding protein [Euzebya pacifica]|uniref:Metal binding protein n=1 Tax=Euzebya pacifica TaxID=1608957 RepID=A0A346XXG5_9ACTN|nr:helical backbone metal receptor [Euzebya pacifica]AXV06912.1 Metal binding protein [Euzebya pacifica]